MIKGLGSRRLRAAALTIGLAASIVAGVPSAQAAAACDQGWTASTIVGGVGNLENLDSDGAGGFYVTGIADGFFAHIDASGKFERLVTGLQNPAGVRVAGRYVYFLTGDGYEAPPGTLQRYDRTTRTVEVLLTGLNGPNGLLLLPDGDLLFATMGLHASPTGISRYRPATGEYNQHWAVLPTGANGLALTADGTSIYVSNMTMRIFRIPLAAPGEAAVITGLPQLLILPDDMEATRDGKLFVADHLEGAVFQIDTATGAACTIIKGLIKPGPTRMPADGATSVRIARDGGSLALFVTSMDGTLRRLRPPAGFDLTPADATHR